MVSFFPIYPSSLGGDNSQLDYQTLTNQGLKPTRSTPQKPTHPGWTLKTSSRSSKPKWEIHSCNSKESPMAEWDGHPWCWTFFNVFFVQTFDDPTDSEFSWFLCEAIHSHGMPWDVWWFLYGFCCPAGRHFWGLFIPQDSRFLRAKRMIPKAIKRWVSEDWVRLMKIGGSGPTPVVAILMRSMMITLW